jgi:hypothetical protein
VKTARFFGKDFIEIKVFETDRRPDPEIEILERERFVIATHLLNALFASSSWVCK